MAPITPVKRKGSMGPPSSPYTPSTASPRSVIRTPGTSSSSMGRGRSETPFQVKAESMDPPSPSPRMSRAPSRLPSMSPSSGALVPYRPRAPSSTPSPSWNRAIRSLREMSSISQKSLPAEPFSIPRARRPSSTRSPSTFSLASSDDGERFRRRETSECDKRTRNVRPRESREGSASSAVPIPTLPPLPPIILDSSTEVVDIITGLYVQDIDAEEGDEEKDKEQFKDECLESILIQMFEAAGLSQQICKELADEEVMISERAVSLLLNILGMGIADILTSSSKNFVSDDSKVKSKVARQTAWYAKYRAGLPGFARLLTDLSKTDAATILSLLAQEWAKTLPALYAVLSAKSASAKKGQCRVIADCIRKLCDVLIGDIWTER